MGINKIILQNVNVVRISKYSCWRFNRIKISFRISRIANHEKINQCIQFYKKLKTMLSNNDILKKLRVALELKDEDVIKILKLVDYEISKSELGALYRKPDHPNYKACGDQLLRNFLNGLVIYKRGPMPPKKTNEQKQYPK